MYIYIPGPLIAVCFLRALGNLKHLYRKKLRARIMTLNHLETQRERTKNNAGTQKDNANLPRPLRFVFWFLKFRFEIWITDRNLLGGSRYIILYIYNYYSKNAWDLGGCSSSWHLLSVEVSELPGSPWLPHHRGARRQGGADGVHVTWREVVQRIGELNSGNCDVIEVEVV